MKTLPEILALAMEHDCTVLDNDDGYSPNYCFGESELQSFVAAIEQRGYERGLEDAAKKCDTDNGLHGRWLAEDIRAMKEPTE